MHCPRYYHRRYKYTICSSKVQSKKAMHGIDESRFRNMREPTINDPSKGECSMSSTFKLLQHTPKFRPRRSIVSHNILYEKDWIQHFGQDLIEQEKNTYKNNLERSKSTRFNMRVSSEFIRDLRNSQDIKEILRKLRL